MLIYLFLFFILMCGSAFFSGMEAAIFSLSRFRLRTLVFEGKKGAQTLSKLRNNPQRTLISILLSNDIVNIGAASVGTIILTGLVNIYHLSKTWAFIMEIILMTVILLVIGEITPKVIAYSNSEFFALRLGKIIEVICTLFMPIATFAENLINRITQRKKITSVSEEEIRFMLREAEKSGLLDKNEEYLALQILKFGKTMVKEVMTPKEKVVAIGIGTPLSEARRVIQKTRHSRLCVLDEKGNVQGILYAKDFLLNPVDDEAMPAARFMRKPYFVSDSKLVDDLLLEFRRRGVHFGAVISEKNEFLGVITLDDILRFLFGDIINTYS
ncbi:MAG: hemolysin family protein [candidate division WOR-3 bacterium]